MNKFKQRWDIQASWQLIHPFLGILALCLSSFFLVHKIFGVLLENTSPLISYSAYLAGTLIFYFILLKITLWLFGKLENKWTIDYRWQLIAIFMVFAITGSASARVSGPALEFIGFDRNIFSEEWYWAVLYWIIRILIIFPIYQVLLIVIGFLFGQYRFFRDFEEKMLSRMGLSFLFPSR